MRSIADPNCCAVHLGPLCWAVGRVSRHVQRRGGVYAQAPQYRLLQVKSLTAPVWAPKLRRHAVKVACLYGSKLFTCEHYPHCGSDAGKRLWLDVRRFRLQLVGA